MTVISHFPSDDTTNGWSCILSPREPNASLANDIKGDWVVVGGGFAGLAAARRLAENRPQDKVVLVDASAAGENASGRNSGFAIDLPHNVGSSLDELDHAHRYMKLARTAIDYNETVVEKHAIQCDWGRKGKYHAAVTPRGVHEVLVPTMKELDGLGEPYRLLEGDDLAAEIGTPYYTAAVYTPGCVLMNPAALCRGLADTLPDNVAHYEKTPVTQVDCSNGVTLTTANGSVRAPKMILTVNGFAGEFGYFKGRLLPFAAYGTLTRPLNADERAALGGKDDWGLTPANAFAGITMRFTRDHRLLIRQNIHYNPGMNITNEKRAAVQRDHERLFHDRFPMLPNVTMEHTWTGYLCLSRNGAPGFGMVAPGVYTAVCQNAVGATKGTISGLLAADMACGEDNPLIADFESLGTPNMLPPRPFLDIGVRARFAWELFTNRHEA